jgi:hypothetical protein
MIDRRCGNCKYIGAETGEKIDLRGEMQSLHFCENDKSVFKACIKTATGCREFKQQEESEGWHGKGI